MYVRGLSLIPNTTCCLEYIGCGSNNILGGVHPVVFRIYSSLNTQGSHLVGLWRLKHGVRDQTQVCCMQGKGFLFCIIVLALKIIIIIIISDAQGLSGDHMLRDSTQISCKQMLYMTYNLSGSPK